ncbi:CopD family protein [Winogradskyella undariae]|uniref:CopD family protein n=1 Tax=Winogradskyella TaxID=286104 RepID=UPI00156B2C53|nr:MULTISPECIES: CopD family protein [Winogradskyella]NRR92169.1 CopD family protein [Winogradskyella undariae]QXP80228.1 CopD family protein [Winogradskyella sp. HaHa_3_26]
MLLKLIIFLHIICATIWTGGHLILALGFLPKALSKNDFSIIEQFESKFERIGIPALLILVITGIYMASIYTTDFFKFDFSNHQNKHIYIKLILLLCTVLLAVHARFFLIPKKKLKPLAYHIGLVTLIAVLFVFVGFSLRSGGLL